MSTKDMLAPEVEGVGALTLLIAEHSQCQWTAISGQPMLNSNVQPEALKKALMDVRERYHLDIPEEEVDRVVLHLADNPTPQEVTELFFRKVNLFGQVLRLVVVIATKHFEIEPSSRVNRGATIHDLIWDGDCCPTGEVFEFGVFMDKVCHELGVQASFEERSNLDTYLAANPTIYDIVKWVMKKIHENERQRGAQVAA